MRIAQIVTLVSPDGAYGGPLRVALNQARALQALGHEVTILGGYRGYSEPPTQLDGVELRLFPVRAAGRRSGFAGLYSIGLIRHLLSVSRSFDIFHIHLARDLVTLPAARFLMGARVPFVAQTHGMIVTSGKRMARPLDAIFTRPVLRAAKRVFYLTEVEKVELAHVGRNQLALGSLMNGVPRANAVLTESEFGNLEVLYLSRLQARKRPTLFAEVAASLTHRFDDVDFALVGPDEGEADKVSAVIHTAGASARVRWEGPLDPLETLNRMRRSAIFVLPSIDEPFPMAVLEAMSVGLPVVVSDSCGLAGAVAKAEAGFVTDSSRESLEVAIATLIGDPSLRRKMGENASHLVESSFSMDVVATRLAQEYSDALAPRAAS